MWSTESKKESNGSEVTCFAHATPIKASSHLWKPPTFDWKWWKPSSNRRPEQQESPHGQATSQTPGSCHQWCMFPLKTSDDKLRWWCQGTEGNVPGLLSHLQADKAGHYNRGGVHSASKDRIKNCGTARSTNWFNVWPVLWVGGLKSKDPKWEYPGH